MEIISIVINYANGKSQTLLSTTVPTVETQPDVRQVQVPGIVGDGVK